MSNNDWIDIHKDPQHIAREKKKARELKKSQWWKNRIADGECHYCHQHFLPQELTLDHVVPLARGGRSTRSNVVAACKSCNTEKKYQTPAEMLLNQLNLSSSRHK